MPSGVSPVFGVVETPIGTKTFPTGVVDDWKFKEGRPPGSGSPLVPYLYYSWDKLKWVGEPIIPPRLSFQGFIQDTGENKKYTLPMVINHPSYVKDYHIISIRKIIEQLFSPKIHAHIHLEIKGQIFVKPLYTIAHGSFKSADVYEYWKSIIPPTNPDKPYVFSIGGFVSNHNGHSHLWNAGASGYNTWKCKLHFDHGGSISEEIGNYEITKVEYSYKLEKYYRKVYSQDGDNIFTGDIDSFTRKVHLQLYDSFDAEWLIGYAVDVGEYWSHPGNTNIYSSGDQVSISPKSFFIAGINRFVTGNILMTSCQLPARETVRDKWFSGAATTHDVTRPYSIRYNHQEMFQYGTSRFIQLSVYADDLGESIPIEYPLRYFSKTTSEEWRVVTKDDPYFEVNVQEADVVESQVGGGAGSSWVTSLIGTKLQPMFRITAKDLNGNTDIYIVTETELYGSDISYLTGETSSPEPTN